MNYHQTLGSSYLIHGCGQGPPSRGCLRNTWVLLRGRLAAVPGVFRGLKPSTSIDSPIWYGIQFHIMLQDVQPSSLLRYLSTQVGSDSFQAEESFEVSEVRCNCVAGFTSTSCLPGAHCNSAPLWDLHQRWKHLLHLPGVFQYRSPQQAKQCEQKPTLGSIPLVTSRWFRGY